MGGFQGCAKGVMRFEVLGSLVPGVRGGFRV